MGPTIVLTLLHKVAHAFKFGGPIVPMPYFSASASSSPRKVLTNDNLQYFWVVLRLKRL